MIMKCRYLMMGLSLCCMSVFAQTHYDAANYSERELNGTARFVGMGGAMGALGADISVMGTNPAGIGLFRGNDFSTSFGFNANLTSSTAGDMLMKDKSVKASFDQMGLVYSMKIGNRTPLRYVNIGFNYHKDRNFNSMMRTGGFLDGSSQTQQMATMMDGFSNEQIDDIYNYGVKGYEGIENPYYSNNQYPYLGILGVRTGLVAVDADNGKKIGWVGDSNAFQGREEGGIHHYDFNVSLNLRDRVYLGMTIGVDDVRYRRSTYYTEDVYDGEDGGFYELMNDFATDGTGVNFKLGAIFRPIEDSPFRFGVAVHTPTWFNLTDYYQSYIYSELEYNFVRTDEDGNEVTDVSGKPIVDRELVKLEDDTRSNVDGDIVRDYQLKTPWRFNVSAGTVVFGRMAIGAEYEYAATTSSKLYYYDGYEMADQNSIIKEDLKGVHTAKVGLEFRVLPSLSLRAGYNYNSSMYRETAYKALGWNDMRTDVEYNNKFAKNTVTAGLGFAHRSFYIDVAYKYDTYKSDFYAFSDDNLLPIKVNNDRHQLLFTLGAHF